MDTTLSGGATIDLPNGLFGSLRVRHFDDVPPSGATYYQGSSKHVVLIVTIIITPKESSRKKAV